MMMACGCRDRCKRWRAELRKYEARTNSKFARRMAQMVREKLLKCPKE